MKIQHGLIGAGAIGFATGILRIVQYSLTIERDGYYTGGTLSAVLNSVLIGLLAIGAALSLLCGLLQKKEQSSFDGIFGHYLPARILFALIGVAAAADGINRLIHAGNPGMILAGVLCLCGAIGWFLLARGAGAGPALLLPVLHWGAVILCYFWETYKYIQVSEYTLDLLALCAVILFTLLIMKTRAEADCTKGRLTAAACLVVLLGFAALPTGGVGTETIILSVQFFLYILLAAVTLLLLPHAGKPAPEETAAPDPSALDEYISDIPDIKESEEE